MENLRGWLKHTTANIDAVLRTADLRSSISSEINAFGSGVRKSISIASHGLEAFIEAAKLAGRKQLALATRQMRRLSAGRRSFVDATTRDRDALAGEHEVPCLDPSSSVMTERMSSIKDWIPYSGENLHLRLLSAASTLVGEDVDAGKMVEQQQLFVIPKIIVDDYDELMDPFGMYEGVGLLFAEAKAPVFRPRREARERYPGMMTGYE